MGDKRAPNTKANAIGDMTMRVRCAPHPLRNVGSDERRYEEYFAFEGMDFHLLFDLYPIGKMDITQFVIGYFKSKGKIRPFFWNIFNDCI